MSQLIFPPFSFEIRILHIHEECVSCFSSNDSDKMIKREKIIKKNLRPFLQCVGCTQPINLTISTDQRKICFRSPRPHHGVCECKENQLGQGEAPFSLLPLPPHPAKLTFGVICCRLISQAKSSRSETLQFMALPGDFCWRSSHPDALAPAFVCLFEMQLRVMRIC